MTYAESPRSVYTVVPPPRTPVGMDHHAQRKLNGSTSQAPKSLDYWSKSEDKKSGITCYYSRHDMRLPQIRSSPKRPQFVQQQSTKNSTQTTSPRYAPFPAAPNEIMSPMPPPPGIYQNVPAMPRAKLLVQNGTAPAASNGNSNGNVVWGGTKKQSSKDEWMDERATPNTPLTNSYGHNNNNNNNNHDASNSCASNGEKKRSNGRRIPKWGRCFQSLFCCVTPSREIEKSQSNCRTSNNNLSTSSTTSNNTAASNGSPPIQLITQVQRDGTVTGLPSTQIVQRGSGDGPQQQQQQSIQLYDRPEMGANERPLLAPLPAVDAKKKCLVIDLDETLVHSSFKPVKNPDFVIPVEIDGVEHQVYVLKRPYVDEFLARAGQMFECVLFTASLAKYADPVADLLDKQDVFRARLFRESCVFHKGNFVKDLSRLGRSLDRTLIIDNSPASYAFHPENAVPVTTWFDDPSDTELLDILLTLEHLNQYESIYDSLRPEEGPPNDLALLD